MIYLDNLKDGERIYQRCVLVSGRVKSLAANAGASITVSTSDEVGTTIFPQQHWPARDGYFKALLMLSPGTNIVEFSATPSLALKIHLVHVPLLQNPPLHLAILIAKDSPLLIDCPASKGSTLTSTHSSLDAAIAKLRMTAYMWQAITAEDMRAKGLGRRSFRLEEEWSSSALSRHHLFAEDGQHAMQSAAKVHLVRTDRTVAELRSTKLSSYETSLVGIFSDALKQHGGVFASSARPTVAGLVLDAHYSATEKTVLAYTATGRHDPRALSLGIMGSHLTYAWPRFVEEITDSLLDKTAPGDLVSDEHGKCDSMWKACAVGQETFLRQVGHAFGAYEVPALMARRSSMTWPRHFLAVAPDSSANGAQERTSVTQDTVEFTTWNLRDALKFRTHRLFSLPGDPIMINGPPPIVEIQDVAEGPALSVTSTVGIAKISLNGEDQADTSMLNPKMNVVYTLVRLEATFDRSNPLQMEVLDVNGEVQSFDVWNYFKNKNYVRVPGTSIRLTKISVGRNENPDSDPRWEWAVMLKKRRRDGTLVDAKKIDIRVGAVLDGAEVYYKDGTKIPCGPRWDDLGHEMHMGGHQSKKLALPASTEIVKVAVNTYGEGDLQGLRMWRSDGKQLGALNALGRSSTIEYLEPGPGQVIVGFYGRSYPLGLCTEFGIITAPKDAELPDIVYDLPELQNTDGGLGPRIGGHRGVKRRRESVSQNSNDGDTTDDEDCGYDDDYHNDSNTRGSEHSDEGDETMDED